MKSFIFLPDGMNLNCECYLEGFRETHKTFNRVFIIDTSLQKSENSIGFCGPGSHNPTDLEIFVNNKTRNIEIGKGAQNLVIVTYDVESFGKSQLLNTKGQFSELVRNITCHIDQPTNGKSTQFISVFLTILLKILEMPNGLQKYSAIFLQLENTVASLNFIFSSDSIIRQATLKKKCIIISKLFDIILGTIILFYIYSNEKYIISHIQQSTEFIIKGLKAVLNVLMDSPAGLKLNHALTKTLGIFFFYHISLWRAFIHIINPVLHCIFRIVFLPALLGFSFQIAILSDFIAFMTFHVYCIYVYAARLYGIQMYGVRSLWKLFIGRKWNPLRNRIDSFQYTPNQLFVGTLGFTVLLFLLPTIFLNYAVFTAFRLLLLLLNKTLKLIGNIFQQLPLYIIILWIFKSSEIKAALNLQIHKTTKKPHLQFKLNRFALGKTITLSQHSNSETRNGLVNFLQGIFTGSLF